MTAEDRPAAESSGNRAITLSFRHAGLAETAPLCRTPVDNHHAPAQAASGAPRGHSNATGLARKMLYQKRLTRPGMRGDASFRSPTFHKIINREAQ